jgi:hypothetical protein
MGIKEHEMRMAFEAWNYHFINQLNLNNNPVAYPYKSLEISISEYCDHMLAT